MARRIQIIAMGLLAIIGVTLSASWFRQGNAHAWTGIVVAIMAAGSVAVTIISSHREEK